MGLVEYDYAVLDYLLIAAHQIGIQQIVVRHNEQSREPFYMIWIEIRAKMLFESNISHNIDI